MKTEQFWKMKQLDRIEYNQARTIIDKKYLFQLFDFLYMISNLFFIMLIIGILLYVHFNSYIILSKVIYSLIVIAISGTIIFMVMDIISFYKKRKAIDFIDNKFLKGGQENGKRTSTRKTR